MDFSNPAHPLNPVNPISPLNPLNLMASQQELPRCEKCGQLLGKSDAMTTVDLLIGAIGLVVAGFAFWKLWVFKQTT